MRIHQSYCLRPWASYLFTVIFITFHSAAGASSSITVKKIRGKQAIVELNAPLEEGKTYQIETEKITLETDFSEQFKSRYNSISIGADLSFFSGTKTLDNNFSFIGKYGWNYTNFEFGPVVNLQVYDKGFGTSTTYLLGGYFDYNYIPNKAPCELIFGPSVQLLLGNRTFETGGSAQLSQAQLSLFLTWYINNSPLALKSELGYQIRRVTSSTGENDLSGVVSQIYMAYYF